jgi:hypothetical protein
MGKVSSGEEQLKDWRNLLEFVEVKEVEFAKVYATAFGHFTPGHLSYVVIAKLAAILDEVYRTGNLK